MLHKIEKDKIHYILSKIKYNYAFVVEFLQG